MRAHLPTPLSALLIATMLLSCVAAHGDGKPKGWAATTTLPGAGHGLDPRGRLDPAGVVQINIPVGYTLSEGQWLLSAWAADVGGPGVNMQASASVGLLPPGAGLSLSPARSDRATSQTGHIQKQLWPETGVLPAVSAGVLDIADEFQRSYYVAATKRLRIATPAVVAPPLQAVGPAWPPAAEAAEGTAPAWGTARLAQAGIAEAGVAERPDEILIPSGAAPPLLDGMIGRDWDDAAQVKLALPGGELLLLGAKHFEGVLYVMLAVPSERVTGPGARAEVHFRTPERAAYRLEVDAGGDLVRLRDSGVGWRAAWSPSGAEVFRGVAADAGDGAWRYPVFELAIPLAEIGLAPDASEVGFFARVELPEQAAPALPAVADRQHVNRWPRGNYSFVRAQHESFEARPDSWGIVVAASTRARPADRIGAPALDAAPTIDGLRDENEWAGADRREAVLEPGVTHTLHAGRCADFLYIASVWLVAAGHSFDQELHLYVDTFGDGGLLPRPDDRRFSITAEGASVEMEAFSWDERERKWSARERIPFRAAVGDMARREGVESVVEVAIPLNALGLSAMAQQTAFGLGVETAVTAVPRHAPEMGRLAQGTDHSTYVTAAWGTGMYHNRMLFGVSQPVGDMSAVAEYDGDRVNVGVSGPVPGVERARFTVGWSGLNEGGRDSGPLLGITYGGGF